MFVQVRFKKKKSSHLPRSLSFLASLGSFVTDRYRRCTLRPLQLSWQRCNSRPRLWSTSASWGAYAALKGDGIAPPLQQMSSGGWDAEKIEAVGDERLGF